MNVRNGSLTKAERTKNVPERLPNLLGDIDILQAIGGVLLISFPLLFSLELSFADFGLGGSKNVS